MFLSDIPKELNAPGDWRAAVDNHTVLLANALRHADNHMLVADYTEIDDNVDAAAHIQPFTDTLVLGYNANTELPRFLHRAAHEIKHHSQITGGALMFAWYQLYGDLATTINSGEVRFRQHYNLPSPASSVLAHLVAEIDASNFGVLCEAEATQALDLASFPNDWLDQDTIDQTHYDMLNDPNIYATHVSNHLEMLMGTVMMVRDFMDKDGPMPSIKLVDLPVSLVSRSTSRLWRNGANDFTSPFSTPEGATDIAHMMGKVVQEEPLELINRLIRSYLRPENRTRHPMGGLDFG